MNFCNKHKGYSGMSAPAAGCDACLSLYASRGAQRPERVVLGRAPKVFKDKSKYSRKEKHKPASW